MKLLSVVSCQLSVVIGFCSASSSPEPVAHVNEPSGSVSKQMPKDQGPRTKDKFAVIISGVGGDPEFTKRFAGWTEAMCGLLRHQLDFAEDAIFYLTPAPPETARPTTVTAMAAEVRSVFEQLKMKARPHSLIFVFLIGHGSFENQQAKFNLIGPDLTAEDFDRMLDALPTQNVILVNAASASGAFINALSQPGRVVITATRSGHERNATTFAEYFIQAFKDDQADFDKNHRVSLLEAFNYAAKTTAQWYEQEGRLATEHALLDDNGDKVGHGEATEGDGALARTPYLDSRPFVPAAGDPEVQKLMAERERLERAIEALKARKAEVNAAAYDAELERLLIRLAQVNQKIKARQP